VHRDGIHFSSLRYIDPILAEHVRRSVTIRYDPRDISEIRVFLNDRFLCRAISPQHADETITLKDIQAARTRRRRELRDQLNRRRSLVDALSMPAPDPAVEIPPIPLVPSSRSTATALKTYEQE
jgi:putative transposase